MSRNEELARRVFVALDLPTAAEAEAMADRLAPTGVGLKMGLELFTAEGPALAARLAARASLFLDLKYHDIPATVARSVAAATRIGASVMNLHVSGGEAMVKEAIEARDRTATELNLPTPRLIGVTVLTSMDGADLNAVWSGGERDASAEALRLAERARDWGLDGVVASAKEAAAIRAACGEGFLVVTPGIRPAGAETGDQKRVLTPGDALAAGASHLVIGRPVTRAADPAAACAAILDEMAAAV